MALGTDIVKISRIEHLIKDGIPEKVFSAHEILYINSKKNKAQTAAGIFAAKEAVLKALGCGITLPLRDAEILHDENGAPYLMLNGKVDEYSKTAGIIKWEVSISHDGEYAIASATGSVDKVFLMCSEPLKKLKDAPQNAITPQMIGKYLPKRNTSTHKGNYGRLYVLAGSVGLTGAAIMACTSALKCGTGLISLGCAEELNAIFEISMKEVMTKPLKSKNGLITKDDCHKILEEIQNADLCLIGPGLGRSEDLTCIIRNIISSEFTTPLVIDADGLNAISEDTSILENHKMPIILTPHIGEFARLTKVPCEEILKEPKKYALEFAKKFNVVLVLKSHRTLVADPSGAIYENVLGNPGMATGGTGDVLAGAVASFAAQGKSPLEAALTGVYVHSYSADIASFKTGEYSLTPSDIIEHLPLAIKTTEVGPKEMQK